MSTLPEESVGRRIQALRQEAGLSLGALSETTGISKSYLWNLENKPQHQRPSGATLYEIAKALNTSMSQLLGRQLLTQPNEEIDDSLREFADAEALPEPDLRMLASIRWRGTPPRTVERWRFVYNALKASQSIDRSEEAAATRRMQAPRRRKRSS